MNNIYAKVLNGSGVDFGAVRDGRRSTLSHFDVDLSSARSIAAGTHLVLNVAGDALVSDLDPVNQGPVVIYVQDTNLTSPGSPVYFPPGAILKVPYTQVLIENAAQPGKRLRVFYGVGIDFSVGAAGNVNVSGTVSTIDGNKARTLAGGAFAWRPTSAAVNRAHAQLWNPNGSGKNLIVDALILTLTAAGAASVGTYNTQLSTAGQAISNLRSDSAAVATAVPLVQDIAGASFTRIYGTALMAANAAFDFTQVLKRPIVIGPNTGLVLISEVGGATLSGFVSFFEEVQ